MPEDVFSYWVPARGCMIKMPGIPEPQQVAELIRDHECEFCQRFK